VGKRWAQLLRAEMVASAPSGHRYRIIMVDESAPAAGPGQKSQRYIDTGADWQASSKKQPPAMLSGTLMESISYRIIDGVLLVGQLIGVSGDEDLMGTEIRPLFFRGRNRKDLKEGYAGRLFVSMDGPKEQTPVRKYSGALEHGFANWFSGKTVQREWFGNKMEALRDELKEELRTEIWSAIRKKTRSTQIQKALIVKIYMTKA